jgi:hypothetical protein
MPMAKSVTYNIHRTEQWTLIVMPLVVMAKEATQSTDTWEMLFSCMWREDKTVPSHTQNLLFYINII